jgi:hypothetical protein
LEVGRRNFAAALRSEWQAAAFEHFGPTRPRKFCDLQAAAVQTQGRAQTYSPPAPSKTPSTQDQSILTQIPIWVWIGAAIVLFVVLFG